MSKVNDFGGFLSCSLVPVLSINQQSSRSFNLFCIPDVDAALYSRLKSLLSLACCFKFTFFKFTGPNLLLSNLVLLNDRLSNRQDVLSGSQGVHKASRKEEGGKASVLSCHRSLTFLEQKKKQ